MQSFIVLSIRSHVIQRIMICPCKIHLLIFTADKATMGYINKKIDELDEEHSRLKKEIADMSADICGKKDVGVIKNCLNNWESISISDKITVVDAWIESVRVNQDTVDIVWKI